MDWHLKFWIDYFLNGIIEYANSLKHLWQAHQDLDIKKKTSRSENCRQAWTATKPREDMPI